jgi:hypothetical protein
VAVHRTPFVRAAKETSELFASKRLDALVYTDITASLCALAGISGGMLCALLGGGWTFATHKPLTSPVAIACFFIGYLMVSVVRRSSFFVLVGWLKIGKLQEIMYGSSQVYTSQVKTSLVKSTQVTACGNCGARAQVRVAMAVPHGAVCAHYVCYAHNPASHELLTSPIPERLKELLPADAAVDAEAARK